MENVNNSEQKNQRIVLHTYDLIYGAEIRSKKSSNETQVNGVVLYFQQRRRYSIFRRVYAVRVPLMSIRLDVLTNGGKLVVQGYVEGNHLHVVERISEDLQEVDQSKYEEIGSFEQFTGLNEGEELSQDLLTKRSDLSE